MEEQTSETRPPLHWIDLRTGDLLIGEAAAEERLAEAGPDIVVAVGSLLLASERDRSRPDIWARSQTVETAAWDREDYLDYGRWLLKILSDATGRPDPRLKYSHLRTMRQLGIGPEFENKMRDHVGKLYDFKAALETDIGRSRGRFDDWSTSDFIAYGYGLTVALGRKPSEKDYNHAFHRGQGPSNEIIIGRFGSVGELNEYLGFPNVRAWDKLDFVDWGVRVLQANHATRMTRTIIDELSRRRRGPSETAVRLRFGKISNFNALVRTEMLTRTTEIEIQQSGKDASYVALAKAGELPSDFPELPRQERLRIGAIWQLLGKCCPRMTPQRRFSIAYGPSDRMIAAVRAKNPIPAADIEALAVDLQLFDDIWPSANTELVIDEAPATR